MKPLATRAFYDAQHQTLVLYIPTKHCISYDAQGQGKEKDIGGEIVECIFDFEREKCLLRSSQGEKELLLDRCAGICFLNPATGETEKLDFPYLQEELRHLQHTLLYGEKTQRYAQEFQDVASTLNLLPENTFEEDLLFLTQQEEYRAGKDYSALFSPNWNLPLHVWRDYRQNMSFVEEFGTFSYHAPTDTLTFHTDDGNEIALNLSSPNLYGAEINGDLMFITSQEGQGISSTETLGLKVGDLLGNGLMGKTSLRATILDKNTEALKNLPQVLESLAKERGVLHPVKRQYAFSRFNDAINEKLAGEKIIYEEDQRAERARIHEEQRIEAKAHLFDTSPYQIEKEMQPTVDKEAERKAFFQLQNNAARKILEQQKKVTVMDDEPLINEEHAQAIMQRIKGEVSNPVWESGAYDEEMGTILPTKPFKTTFHWVQKDGQIFCLHNQIASKGNEGFSRYVYDWNHEIKNGTRKDAPLKLEDEASYLTYVMNQASGKNNPKGWEEAVAVDPDKVFLVIRNDKKQVAKVTPYEFFQKQNVLENGKETTDAYSREIFEYGRQHRKKNYTDVEKVPQQSQGQSDKDFAKIIEAYNHRMFFWNGLPEKERPAYEEAVQKEDYDTIKAIEEKRFSKLKQRQEREKEPEGHFISVKEEKKMLEVNETQVQAEVKEAIPQPVPKTGEKINAKRVEYLEKLTQGFKRLEEHGKAVYQQPDRDYKFMPTILGVDKEGKLKNFGSEFLFKQENISNGANLLSVLQCNRKNAFWMAEYTVQKLEKEGSCRFSSTHQPRPLKLTVLNQKGEYSIQTYYNVGDLEGPFKEKLEGLWPQKADEEHMALTPNKLIAAMTNKANPEMTTLEDPLLEANRATVELLEDFRARMKEKADHYKELVSSEECRKNFKERFEKIAGEPLTPPNINSTIDDRFLYAMQVYYQAEAEDVKHGLKHDSYVVDAALDLKQQNFSRGDITGAINRCAPQSVTNPARKEVYGLKDYSDWVWDKIEKREKAKELAFGEGLHGYKKLRQEALAEAKTRAENAKAAFESPELSPEAWKAKVAALNLAPDKEKDELAKLKLEDTYLRTLGKYIKENEKLFEAGKVDAPNMTTVKSISPGMKAARELVVEKKSMSLDTMESLAFKHMPEMAFTKAKQAVLGEWVKPYNFFVKDTIKKELAEQKALEAKKAGTRGFDKEVKKKSGNWFR